MDGDDAAKGYLATARYAWKTIPSHGINRLSKHISAKCPFLLRFGAHNYDAKVKEGAPDLLSNMCSRSTVAVPIFRSK